MVQGTILGSIVLILVLVLSGKGINDFDDFFSPFLIGVIAIGVNGMDWHILLLVIMVKNVGILP
jgi:uncharacterized membrane protein